MGVFNGNQYRTDYIGQFGSAKFKTKYENEFPSSCFYENCEPVIDKDILAIPYIGFNKRTIACMSIVW